MKARWIVLVFAVGIVALLSMARRSMDMAAERIEGIPAIEYTVRTDRPDAVEIDLVMKNVGADRTITEVTLPVSLLDSLEAWTPEGFEKQPFASAGLTDQDDMEAARRNAENIRWVGRLPLKANATTTFRIPARNPSAGTGTIQFTYEGRGGRKPRTFDVRLEAKPPPDDDAPGAAP